MNALQVALVNAGLTKAPKERKPRYKIYTCHRCGNDMIPIYGTNIMACENCKNYFIFDNKEF